VILHTLFRQEDGSFKSELQTANALFDGSEYEPAGLPEAALECALGTLQSVILRNRANSMAQDVALKLGGRLIDQLPDILSRLRR